jgi:AcrR family transcriptional regulator
VRSVNPDQPPPRPLPRGRHSPGGEVVAESQRTRLLDAIVELVATNGYAGVKVGSVARGAGVSLSTFYEHFDGTEACFLAAYDSAVEALVTDLVTVVRDVKTLEDGVSVAVVGFLRWFADRPAAARTILVEIRGAGAVALARRTDAVARFVELASQLLGATGRKDMPPSRARLVAILAGVEALAAERVIAGHPEQIVDVIPDAIDVALTLMNP